jgi:hypothetical protein
MKRYFLAETATSKYIGIATIEGIAAAPLPKGWD